MVEIAIRKAKAAEEKLEGQSRFNKVYSRRSVPQTTGNDKYIPPNLREDRRRSLESQRIKEGKCKRCGEKWDPRHRCQIEDNSKKLYTCEAEKDDESDSAESINEEMENFQNDTSKLIEDNTPRISLATITGITQPQTLKLKGHIKNDNVIVLIDTRSTHNFLDIKIARKLKLFVYLVPDMKVMVADGKKIWKCREMP
jgi:hypothetical protein